MKRIKLDDLGRKIPFQVPEDYFDQLTVDIQTRVNQRPKQIWLPAPELKWTLVAAVVLAIIAFIWIFPTTNSSPSAEQLLAEVDEQALMDYLDMNEFTETELLEGVSNELIYELWNEEDALDELEFEGEDLDEILTEYENEI